MTTETCRLVIGPPCRKCNRSRPIYHNHVCEECYLWDLNEYRL